jgi:DNA-binding response OmpR family regulator
MATTLAGEWQDRDDTTVVGDVVISSRTSTIRIGREDISFTPVKAELFKLLVLNAGKVVSRAQLFHPFTGKKFPSAHLNAHMCDLRRKLGPGLSKRIETIVTQGYRYLIPIEFDSGFTPGTYTRP